MDFKLHADYAPTGDQPQAIEALVRSLQAGHRHQTLLGPDLTPHDPDADTDRHDGKS